MSVLKKFSSEISFKICISSLNLMLISNDLLMYNYLCVPVKVQESNTKKKLIAKGL